jgi:hypothetical protein
MEYAILIIRQLKITFPRALSFPGKLREDTPKNRVDRAGPPGRPIGLEYSTMLQRYVCDESRQILAIIEVLRPMTLLPKMEAVSTLRA